MLTALGALSKSINWGRGKMTAKIISGTEIAKEIREELKKEVTELKEKHNVVPG
jgi:ArsR family metal-binding transcriptional regulator